MRGKLKIIAEVGAEPTAFQIHVTGRKAWALLQLVRRGPAGLTSVENPAPRLSSYIHRLRGLGVTIDTENESHGGEFSGSHARYRLNCQVRILTQDNDSPEGPEAA